MARSVVSVAVLVGVVAALCAGLWFVTNPRFHVNKVGAILITGSSTGIGKDAALALDKAGYHVFAGVRKEKDAQKLREEGSGRLHPIILDVTKPQHIADAAEMITAFTQSTGLPFAGLVNNAGVSYVEPVEYLDMDTARWVFDVNVFGVIETTKTFIPLLVASKGRIVNVGSVAGLISRPYASIYSGSKFALEAITDTARRELGKQGVSVSLLEPAYVKTEIATSAQGFLNVPDDHPHYCAAKYTANRLKVFGNAATTSVTTNAILDALVNPYPATRYVVAKVNGIPAWMIARLIWLLPDHVADLLS